MERLRLSPPPRPESASPRLHCSGWSGWPISPPPSSMRRALCRRSVTGMTARPCSWILPAPAAGRQRAGRAPRPGAICSARPHCVSDAPISKPSPPAFRPPFSGCTERRPRMRSAASRRRPGRGRPCASFPMAAMRCCAASGRPSVQPDFSMPARSAWTPWPRTATRMP